MRFPFWRRREGELEEEVRHHLELAARERIERGESPAEAWAAARREFGNVGLVKEVTRETWGWTWLDRVAQDVRYGLRVLRKSPGFTAVAVFTLALGIGATSTIFSFVNGILLRPLPYPEPERLVLIEETAPKRGITSMGVSYPNFVDWREQNRVFTGVAVYGSRGITLTGGGEPEILGATLSYNTFEVLGVTPVLGRTFRPEEDVAGQDDVVILSHGLWERRLGADPGVIGRTMVISDRACTVVGVMPPSDASSPA
jgi:hypothetical protein